MKYAPIALSFAALSLRGETGYHVEARYPVPQPSGFDYIMLDSLARRLYLSHGTQVDVIDADGGKVVGAIPNTPGVHGIAIASEFKHGFVSKRLRDGQQNYSESVLILPRNMKLRNETEEMIQ